MSLPASKRTLELAAIRGEASSCVRCPLWADRNHVVFGEGDLGARLVLVGEAPGAREDSEGRPFRGAAGESLERLLEGIKLRRSDVYIANVVMCRPPNNRPPRSSEVRACASYLHEQIRLVGPRVILALGAQPTRRLLGRTATVAASRGRPHLVGGTFIVATYHPSPSSLNRAPERREEVRQDFRMALRLTLSRTR